MRLAPFNVSLFLIASTLAAQQPDPAVVRGIDSLFAPFATGNSPGCAVGLSRNGAAVLTRGYGLADLERSAPITERTVFNIGSTSKQFVTFAVMMLADEGRLSLDDDVRRWIGELPDQGARVTLRQMIHHTSGLRDYATMLSLMGWQGGDQYDESRLLSMIRGWRALNFPPGSRYLYNNTGYVLLATVVHRASGESWPDFAARRIFGPAGMAASLVRRDPFAVVPSRALAYEPDSSGRFRLAMPNHAITGSTAVMTTVTDLARWERNWYQPTVGGASVIRSMHERSVLTSGDTTEYAGGLVIGRYRGVPLVHHAGATGAYSAEFLRFPDQRAAVAVLCNHGGANAPVLARQVADRWLATAFPEPAPPSTRARASRPDSAARISPRDMAGVVGAWYSSELDRTWWIVADEDGGYLLRRRDRADLRLRLIAPDSLGVPGAAIRVLRDGGVVTGFRVSAGRVLGLLFEPVGR